VVHGAADASLFICFPASCGGEGGVVVHATLREGPFAGLGADKEKLDLAFTHAVTDGSDVEAARRGGTQHVPGKVGR
jgi:hypothetical protein